LIYAFEDCVLDDGRRELWRAASSVSVGPQVFDLLVYLLHNRERVVSQDDLLTAIWEGRTVSDSTLRSHINAARTAIGDDGEAQRLIRTMPRKGFRFVGEVREGPVETPAVAAADGAKAVAPRAVAEPAPESDRYAVTPVGTVYAPAKMEAPTSPAQRPPVNGVHRAALIGSAAALLVVVAGVAIMFLYSGSARDTRQASAPPLAQNQTNLLVPELVPFISDADQARIRDVYLPAPDHKAIAINFLYMAFVSAQPDKDTAERAAVAKCQSLTDLNSSGSPARCQLYASGNVVTRGRPPMPQQPWVIHNPSVERPFVGADLPLVKAEDKERAATNYRTLARSKAYVVAPTGGRMVYWGEPSPEEAIRRSLERCGYDSGRACMVIAIDDTFVVAVPTVAKVVGFYRPDALTTVQPGVRDDIARRLANATNGWNAVAVGANGQAGIKIGAGSEQAAVDGAVEECVKHDRECHIAVIGPFLVEPEADRTPARAAGPQ
jgi:DNA-binding winged helix-turn-helix (wHTH) protein